MAHAKLRGKIKEVFNTQCAFAEAMGMSNFSISQRLNGIVAWKVAEAQKACELLNIPLEQMSDFF